MEKTYYISGRNGNAIIERAMSGLGWKQITNSDEANCQLYWSELKSSIEYADLTEGKQIVNHIPNCQLITNKLNLMTNLQEYERACSATRRNVKPLDFLPETYKIDSKRDVEKFSSVYKEGEIWICKPTGRNQGKGIFLVKSLQELELSLASESSDDTHQIVEKPLRRIIQRYIANPLLVDGRKFDIRCYMLISSTIPYLVLYHKGYLRLSMDLYSNNSDNIITHLTNQFIQKKDARYAELKEETAWSMEKFNEYVNKNLSADKNLEQDWVLNTLPKRIKEIIGYIFDSVRHKLERKIGFFELYGLDFMIDEEMKVWLIEVNINPCLATNCSALKEIVPLVVKESLRISIECFEKARVGKPLQPLTSIKNCEIIYSEEKKTSKTVTPEKKRYTPDRKLSSVGRRSSSPKRNVKLKVKTVTSPTSDRQIRVKQNPERAPNNVKSPESPNKVDLEPKQKNIRANAVNATSSRAS